MFKFACSKKKKMQLDFLTNGIYLFFVVAAAAAAIKELELSIFVTVINYIRNLIIIIEIR